MLPLIVGSLLWCVILILDWKDNLPPKSPGESTAFAMAIGFTVIGVPWGIYQGIRIWKKYRKEGVPFSEIPAQTYNAFEAGKVLSSPLQKIVCPYCNNVFKLPILIQPFKVIPSKAICPKCGEKSILVWDSFQGFQIRRKQQDFGVAVEPTVKPINTMVDVCCPYCNSSFQTPQQSKPFRVKCPKCSKESMFR